MNERPIELIWAELINAVAVIGGTSTITRLIRELALRYDDLKRQLELKDAHIKQLQILTKPKSLFE